MLQRWLVVIIGLPLLLAALLLCPDWVTVIVVFILVSILQLFGNLVVKKNRH